MARALRRWFESKALDQLDIAAWTAKLASRRCFHVVGRMYLHWRASVLPTTMTEPHSPVQQLLLCDDSPYHGHTRTLSLVHRFFSMDDGGPQFVLADEGGGDLPGMDGGAPPAHGGAVVQAPAANAPTMAQAPQAPAQSAQYDFPGTTGGPYMGGGGPAGASGPIGGVGPESVKLFFGQVPRTWSDLEVREIFDKYGTIRDFIVLKYKDTGNSKGEPRASSIFWTSLLLHEACSQRWFHHGLYAEIMEHVIYSSPLLPWKSVC